MQGIGVKTTILVFTVTLILSGVLLYNGHPRLPNIRIFLGNQSNVNSNLDVLDNMVYHPPINALIHGEYFHEVDKTLLSNLLPAPVTIDKNNIENFIFVSAANSNYYERLTLLVESIQAHFPAVKLVIYDLGLSDAQLKRMRKWCNVEVHTLDFEKYPPHVKILFSYAFKPIVIAEALKEFQGSGVFWVDSSVRFKNGDIASLQDVALYSNGVCAFPHAGHSVYSTTPQEMFKFLPMVKNPKKKECLAATLVLLYKTQPVIDGILRWWVACALSPTCIYSFHSRFCRFTKDRWNDYAHCSRYDQSALSIILYNAFPQLSKAFAPGASMRTTIRIQRGGGGGKIKSCKHKSN